MAVLLLFLAIVFIITFTNFIYKRFINTYFRKDDIMIYDYFMKNCLKVVSSNNFMNYGLWDDENNTLEKANINLCEFVFSKINQGSEAEEKRRRRSKRRILDVGCGYGCQDILFRNKLVDKKTRTSPKTKIYAIDISEKQIEHAIDTQKKNNISTKQLSYRVGNALTIKDQFNHKFDTILSLESAFHYSDRPLFFNNVHSLLKDDGVFVITDIILNDNKPSILSSIFINFAIDFFNIPESNLIRLDRWKKTITDSGLEFIEIHNITEQTFDPYYSYFFENYYKNSPLLAAICRNAMNYIQPFSYVVAVCKKIN